MKKILNEGNQIHNVISSSGSGTVINYGSGFDFITSYGSDSGKSYGSYGSGSTTLVRTKEDSGEPQQILCWKCVSVVGHLL